MQVAIPALMLFLWLAIGAPVSAQQGGDSLVKAQEAAAALHRGDAQSALRLYTEALEDPALPNDRRASMLNDRAVVYGRLSRPRLAIEDFNRALQFFPENAAVYNNRGNTLLALGLTTEAIKDFDRAIVLAPGYAAAYNNRAGALMRLGQTADALRDYTKAIELMPASAAPLGGRGRVHLAEQRPHAALRDFNRAISADARFAVGYRSRAEAKMAVGRYGEAVEDLSRAIAFDPANIELVRLRGQAYLMADDVSSAINDFSRAVELDPGRAALYEVRGLAHLKAEAFEDGEADLARSLELNPRSARAYAYRAWLYKQTGQPEVAMRELEKAERIDPNLAEVLWVRGEVAEALGRTEEAIASLRKAVALAPDLSEAVEALDRLGADQTRLDEVEVDGLGLDPWRVLRRQGRYVAVSQNYPKLRVPLEMTGQGQPRLLEWDVRKAPFDGIATLRFHAGRISGRDGIEELEQVAILDLTARTIVAIEPHRQGAKVASWQWEGGKLVVESVDGVRDEFTLRAAPRVSAGPVPERRTAASPSNSSIPFWAPWAQQPGYGGSRNRAPSGPRPKPKTLFDMLLGN